MKPLFPVLLLLAFCLNAAAQSTKQIDTAKQRERNAKLDASYQPYAEGRMTAKINFLSLIDPETPTIQTGIEYRFSKRVSGEFTYGIPVKIHGDVRPTDSTYYRYSKFRIEIRYFPFERKAFYLAPEATFISKERSKYDGSYYGKDGEDYTYDYAEIDKSIVAGALKFGLVTPFRKNNRWIMDVFLGFGPRFIRMKINAINARPGGSGWIDWPNDEEGSTTSFHATMGIKFGYIIF